MTRVCASGNWYSLCVSSALCETVAFPTHAEFPLVLVFITTCYHVSTLWGSCTIWILRPEVIVILSIYGLILGLRFKITSEVVRVSNLFNSKPCFVFCWIYTVTDVLLSYPLKTGSRLASNDFFNNVIIFKDLTRSFMLQYWFPAVRWSAFKERGSS